LVPIVLGLDGSYTRFEWISLILIWFLYYYNTINAHQQVTTTKPPVQKDIPSMINNLVYLLWSIALLLLWAHFVVTSGIAIAEAIWVSPVIIGIGVIWLWTVIPELLFAFHAVKQYKDELAVGDLLGTVLADATIVIWIMATILPFEFPEKIIYVTWLFMVTWGILNWYFMSTEKVLAKKEGVFLLLFRIVFVVTEYLVNK
jgi:cation:H+ antiporter